MRYLGGKSKVSEQLANYINGVISEKGASLYIEPFVGAGWILERIKCNERCASDLHEDLIMLWEAVQSGWEPPDTLSVEEYIDLKMQPPSALRAFAGFGCSFGGKWFGGYARDNSGRNYAGNAKRSLLKKTAHISGVKFSCKAYSDIEILDNSVVYCDIPYKDTTVYGGLPAFDHEKFWDWVRAHSESSCILVSEYQAPSDFCPVLEIETRADMQSTKQGQRRVEKLFRHIG
jgi:DNA adenine methylase